MLLKALYGCDDWHSAHIAAEVVATVCPPISLTAAVEP